MSGGAPGLQNQCGVRKGPGWVRFPFASAIFFTKLKAKRSLLLMWSFIRRFILPGLFLIGGLASLIYGAKFHNLPVLTKETTEKTIEVPEPFSQISPPFPGAQGFARAAANPKKNRTEYRSGLDSRIRAGADPRGDRGRSRLE